MLRPKIKKAILAHAKAEYPNESCGVIVGGEYIPCVNVAKDKRNFFEFDPIELVGAEKEGRIDVYVHSHPDGTTNPSVIDRIQMAFHGKPWMITDGTNIAKHEPDGYVAPLLGREYYHGVLDCYSLVRDYYKRELNIDLANYKRNDVWWESADNKPLYMDNFAAEGFVEVSDVQKHDLILCRLGRTEHVNHALIFLGDGTVTSENMPPVMGDSLVLHHPYGGISLRDIYSEQWQRRAAVIIRHRSLL